MSVFLWMAEYFHSFFAYIKVKCINKSKWYETVLDCWKYIAILI